MGKFFKKEPKQGQPVSTRGFAAGLQSLADAVEYMEIEGGYITWDSRNRPTLHISIQDIDSVLEGLDDLTEPSHVLGKKVDGDAVTYGWVETVTHASQHPEAE